MLWLLFSGLTALFQSLKEVTSKHNLKKIDEYVVSWALRFFALPFLLPLLLFIEIPVLNNDFWVALIFGGGFNLIATIIYMKAIKSSDLSITVPMVTFTPLFLLITSPLILGEFTNIYGMIGVILIVLGSYTLNLKQRRNGYLQPFKALLSEPGPKLMLIVALIWSITSNIDKIGVSNSSPIFWVIAINVTLAIFMFPIMIYKSKNYKKILQKDFKILLPVGLFSALSLIFHMTAISMALVAYVISIKRLSIVMSVLFGHFIFKEVGIKERLFGAVIMIVGVMMIALLG